MRAAIVFLLAMLSAVAKPAAAEWTLISESTSGAQFFIDLATLKKGARPRVWFLVNYPARTKRGHVSGKSLREVDCREEKIRILADRYYTEPMGSGVPTVSSDQPGEWEYVTPDSVETAVVRLLCRDNR